MLSFYHMSDKYFLTTLYPLEILLKSMQDCFLFDVILLYFSLLDIHLSGPGVYTGI